MDEYIFCYPIVFTLQELLWKQFHWKPISKTCHYCNFGEPTKMSKGFPWNILRKTLSNRTNWVVCLAGFGCLSSAQQKHFSRSSATGDTIVFSMGQPSLERIIELIPFLINQYFQMPDLLPVVISHVYRARLNHSEVNLSENTFNCTYEVQYVI